MEIGEALRLERLNLGLTQKQMCQDILSRPFYAKVESGKNGISADNLLRILLAHHIDVNDFFELTKKTYMSQEKILTEQLENNMYWAVNAKNIDLLERYCHKILALPDNEIFKLRAIVTVAYFKGNLDEISDNLPEKLKKILNEGENWTKHPELLRLLANTIPLWPQDELDFLIGRLLTSIKNKKLPELMLEQYLRIFGNYLVTCYEREIYHNEKYHDHINDVIKYTINETSTFKLMIYRIQTYYMTSLFENDIQRAIEIKNDLKKYGYDKITASWPSCDL
ncbi:hypothetical protein KIM322_05590 [Lactobacillus xylocopicola]|uniref:HTH cro/C1-type domain-containing protein n=2 Tax=Lactobacillus xylocopicola TaxID=2976676 RepID=A0ABN6SKZ8_9LACO|nr:hypothetical protein KIM322_05590 [Lactobacillus xylocopicola]